MTADQSSPDARFAYQMSDTEALMWNVESDPWLNANVAVICLLDSPLDSAQFARRLRYAITRIPRLRERAVPGVGKLSPPTWVTDAEFDFDYHVRHLSLPGTGSVRELYDLATRLYEDPFDRTRPLWQFAIIDGVEGGRGALFWKVHHTVSDGIGLIRLAETYLQAERHAEVPPEVDLDRVIGESLAEDRRNGRPDGGLQSMVLAASSASYLWRRQLRVAQGAAREAALLALDPGRARSRAEELVGSVRDTLDSLRGGTEVPGGSSLWRVRSRRRHLESLRLSLDDAKTAGKALGGSVNDFFVAGAVLGALDYHDQRGVDVDALNVAFIVSTRAAEDTAAGGNFFMPATVQIPGDAMSPDDHFRVVRDRIAARRSSSAGEAPRRGLAALAGLINFLPTPVLTQLARSQVAKIDFATSNMRAAPFPLYISGAEVLENAVMGPVAGTAFNLSALSYRGSLDIGVFVDPAAVDDPAGLRDCLAHGYARLLDAGGAPAGDHPAASGGPAVHSPA
jgi:WS/DGAT/MGAT family acyltransferase